ncbi:MAG: hypothetical protein HFG20_05365 [Anaerotruncus sp.]|jgi:hypothetical protein|nr:hypothetical protein [Anaerotruncus sp.]
MKQLFCESGHLTDDALQALIQDEPLDELSRLEIAEHLSFCDRCVARYAAMLEEPVLVSPPETLVPGVIKRLRQRARQVFRSRYTTAIAAASFALVFWNAGLFDIDLSSGSSKVLDAFTRSTISISEKTNNFTDQLTKELGAFLDYFTFERSFFHEKP